MLKNHNGLLEPFQEEDQDKLKSVPVGKMLNTTVTQKRNEKLFRKWHVLVRFAWENWDFDGEGKDYDRFRSDMKILGGYCKQVWSIVHEGYVIEEKSMSDIKQDELVELYQKTKEAIRTKVLNYSRDDMDRIEMQLEYGF